MPIHLACIRGKVEMVRALIQMGSSPTVCAEGEVCDSMERVQKTRIAPSCLGTLHVEQLLQPIYDVITSLCVSNQPNWQPVHFACAQGQKVVVHELIENYGVDPHTEDQVGCMVLVNLRQKLVIGLSRHLD